MTLSDQDVLTSIASGLFTYTFYYPLVMAYVWMLGAIWYYYRYERKNSNPVNVPVLKNYPKVALIVPCHNEEDNAEETISNLLKHNYPNFEVIAVNDGSTDKTAEVLNEMHANSPNLKIIHLAQNQGKAMGLIMAAASTDAEFLICIDGDAVLDRDAARWMIPHFQTSPRVGAVTGNPRIRTRSTLLGKLQVGEFSSIVGLIKRAQRTYGRIFSVSGVITAFRASALQNIGYWSTDSLTEDIDISWKLQLAHWDIRFEPAARCWILMPETLMGLWKQRLRWAMGGVQAIVKYQGMWTSWRKRRMWVIFIEYLASIMWAYSMAAVFLIWLVVTVASQFSTITAELIPGWTGAVISVTCLLQVATGMAIDQRYDSKYGKNLLTIIWYPLVFWIIGCLTTIWAVPKALLRKSTKRTKWESPDRGVR